MAAEEPTYRGCMRTFVRADDTRPPQRLRGQLPEPFGLGVQPCLQVLEDEGVASFAKSFDELIETLREKGDRLAGTA